MTELERAFAEADHRIHDLHEPVEQVLAAYPEHAAELRQLLGVGDVLQAWSTTLTPNPQRATMGRARFLAAAATARSQARASSGGSLGLLSLFGRRRTAALATLGGTLAMFAGGGGLVVASAHALPSNGALYAVRRLVEQARVDLAATPTEKTKLELSFAQERVAEAAQVLTNDNSSDGVSLLQDIAAYDAQAAASAEAAPAAEKAGLLTSVQSALSEQSLALATQVPQTQGQESAALSSTLDALNQDQNGIATEQGSNGTRNVQPTEAPSPSPTDPATPSPVESPASAPDASMSPTDAPAPVSTPPAPPATP